MRVAVSNPHAVTFERGQNVCPESARTRCGARHTGGSNVPDWRNEHSAMPQMPRHPRLTRHRIHILSYNPRGGLDTPRYHVLSAGICDICSTCPTVSCVPVFIGARDPK